MLKIVKSVFIIALCLIVEVSAGQESDPHIADSLRSQLGKTKNERQKALLLLGIVAAMQDDNPDSYGKYLDQLKAITQVIKDDSITMEAEAANGLYLANQNKPEKALKQLDIAISIAGDLHNKDRKMAFLEAECRLLNGANDNLCMEKATSGLELAMAENDKTREVNFLTFMSTLHLRVNHISAALEYLNRSIRINDSMRNLNGLAKNYSMTMAAFGKQKNYKEAERYGLKADSIFNKTGARQKAINTKINLGILYKNLGNYNKSIALFEYCLSQSRDTSVIIDINIEYGIALKCSGANTKAVDIYKRTIALNDHTAKLSDVYLIVFKELAGAYLALNQPDSALLYGKKAEELIKGQEFNFDGYNLNKELLELLYNTLKAKGDGAGAALYHKKYVDFMDTVIARIQEDDVAEADSKFHLSEKNRELKQLIDENELQKVKAQKQQILSIILIVSLILGAGVIVAVIIIYRRTVARNKVLSEQKAVINDQMEQITIAAKMKSKFLANISHELRTPATLLSGMIELVKDTHQANKPKDAERLEIAYSNSLKLQQMIEEILDLSKLETKDLEVKYTVREAAPLLKRMVYSFESLFQKQHLRLDYVNNLPANTYINIDEDKFGKIINNLVYNAIKFNREGGWIKFETGVSDNGKQLIIQLSDSGAGISAEDLPHIFERFYQGKTTDNAKAQGAGIGLALVKEFLLLLGGNIDVTSTQGVGTTFTMYLPLAENVPESDIDPGEGAVEISDWSIFKRRQDVLIIEDNVEMRYYLREIFGTSVNIIEAGNGQEALTILKDKSVDLVISDLMMPVMDGRELVGQLKVNETYKNIPVIMLTALADTENQFSLLRMGVDDYIVKPFVTNELIVRAYNLLKNNLERSEYVSQPTGPEVEPISSQQADEFREKFTVFVVSRINNIELSVNDVAKEFGFTERRLYTYAKSFTGCTPAQLIKEIRLMKAYELLVTGQVFKLDDLAKRVGYEHLSYFSKQFFERFGKRPSEYMK